MENSTITIFNRTITIFDHQRGTVGYINHLRDLTLAIAAMSRHNDLRIWKADAALAPLVELVAGIVH